MVPVCDPWPVVSLAAQLFLVVFAVPLSTFFPALLQLVVALFFLEAIFLGVFPLDFLADFLLVLFAALVVAFVLGAEPLLQFPPLFLRFPALPLLPPPHNPGPPLHFRPTPASDSRAFDLVVPFYFVPKSEYLAFFGIFYFVSEFSFLIFQRRHL